MHSLVALVTLCCNCSWGCLGGNRRPIPPYKPLPPSLDSTFHREKEPDDKHSDKFHFDLKPEVQMTEEPYTKKEENDHSESTINSLENATKGHDEGHIKKDKDGSKVTEKPSDGTTRKPENKHQAPPKENKISNGSASMTGGDPNKSNHSSDMKHEDAPKPVIPLEVQIKPTKSSRITNSLDSTSSVNREKSSDKSTIPKTLTKTFSTSTLNIETSSSVQVIEPTTTKTALQSTAVPSNSNFNHAPSASTTLEPSKSSNFESSITISTPTESLPNTVTRASPTLEKSGVHTLVANTFTKNSGEMFTRRQPSRILSFDKTIISHSAYNEFPWPPTMLD